MDGEQFMNNLRVQVNHHSSSLANPSESSMEAVASSSGIKPKRTSNLLAAFVRRTRNKSKTSGKNSKTIEASSPNLSSIPSNSSVGLRTEEVELIVENYERKLESLETGRKMESDAKETKFVTTTDSEHSMRSGMKIKHQFFRKLIKRQTSNECEKPNVIAIQSEGKKDQTIDKTWEPIQQEDHNLANNILNNEQPSIIGIPSSYIHFPLPMLNITLANGLQTVQALSSRLQEHRKHLFDVFKKYIVDSSFQKELVDILTEHSKFQWEAERRSSALASDMWVYQVEIGRKQERILQESLNSLVRQNRQLQIDYEILFRKHETLIRRLQNKHEHGLKQKCVMDFDSQSEQMMTHNEKLQNKLESYIHRTETLEDEISKLQNENENMERLLSSSSSQIQSLTVLLHQAKTNYELEIESLKQAQRKNEQNQKEAFEACDRLFEDFEDIKRQMKGIPLDINWSKLKSPGTGIADIFTFCGSFVKEMAESLITLQTKLATREKDIDALRDTNCKLQESLKKSATELNDLSRKIEDTSGLETDKIIYEEKCKLLESDLKIARDQLEKIKLEYSLEKSSLLTTISQYEHLNNEILEKNNMIEQTKMFISNISSENMALRSQVDGLNKILSETGAGDVVRELTNNQEQLIYYQSQYYQVLNEKQRLLDQMDVLKTDNKAMLEHQETNYKHLQKQLQDLEKISKDNKILRQQFEREHETVISLQNERKKYLEEKDLLKAIFHHLKSEISRVQKLEGTVSDISKEANKLAMIAEYNKQLGKKLKTEIIEKDKTILFLKTSVEKLNDIQIKDTKEKLSLCYELSEVCQMKDQLNNVLSLEVRKNMALDDSKKKVVQTADSQLRKYEDFQKKERTVLKDLLRDLKIVVRQRDTLGKNGKNF
ncbi:uncharacterized protein isoform X1 [Leptinotarsa decemlineata]|uniref:uncharacterized protein isoform X1 n=1 Tax=Leptinotarsa decemlineata TaxID=7539 RepID=UPI003D307C64